MEEVWTARETRLKDKSHLVTFYKSIFVSQWTIQLIFIYGSINMNEKGIRCKEKKM